MTNWDHRFIELAKHIASWSKDPSTKVGVVIVNDDRVIVGSGYNGFPRGVEDSTERYNDRPTKYQFVVHAELNAILNSSGNVKGCKLYMWPYGPPCTDCAKAIIQAGIKEVIVPTMDFEVFSGWRENVRFSKVMFYEAGIILREVA